MPPRVRGQARLQSLCRSQKSVCLFLFLFFFVNFFISCFFFRSLSNLLHGHEKTLTSRRNPSSVFILSYFILFRYANGTVPSDEKSLNLEKAPGRQGEKKTRRRSPRTLNCMASPQQQASSPARWSTYVLFTSYARPVPCLEATGSRADENKSRTDHAPLPSFRPAS
jgi:hypothetical protein